MSAQSTHALVEARGIVKRFTTRSLLRGTREVRALDGVDLDIYEGEVLALIGESGSGKTTLGKVLLRLLRLDAGEIRFDGEDVFGWSAKVLRQKRRDFQMVFQNQTANLHPKMTVRQMIDESLRLHRSELDRAGREARIDELLTRVSLLDRGDQRPGSLSGGERRRVGLARILATRPRLIVADEPTSGLDAAIKLQTIDLLKELKDDDLTYLLISHDLGLVRRIADRVCVMLKGRIIEECPAAVLGESEFHHPYTGRLMRAADLLDDRAQPEAAGTSPVESEATSAWQGCVYAEHCLLAQKRGIVQRCRTERPPLVKLAPEHRVACFGAEPPEEDG